MLVALSNLVSGVLSRARFSLAALAPPTLLGLLIAFLFASHAYTDRHASLRTGLTAISHSPGWTVFTGFTVFVIVLVARPFQAMLVQFLEGYWSGRFSHAAAIATERHHRRLDSARVVRDAIQIPEAHDRSLRSAVRNARALRRYDHLKARAERIVAAYPEGREDAAMREYQDRLMPTMLGNILRAGEDQAGGRYGLDMPLVYPRMYPAVAAGKLADPINQQIDLISSTASMCVASCAGALASSPLLALHNWWSFVPAVCVVLAFAAYRGALRAAAWHATLLATAFDLHRFDLHRALHLELPDSPAAEFELNRQISRFFSDRIPLKESAGLRKRKYVHSETSSGPKSASSE